MKLSRIVISGLLVLFAAGCAGTRTKEGATTVSINNFYEKCVELVPNQVLDYSFEASSPINFKILYREKGNVFYSYSKDYVLSDKGTFYPEKRQRYCMTWINLFSEPVNLSHTYGIRE